MALVATSEAIKINKDDTTAADIKKITETANAAAGQIETSTDETIGKVASSAADVIREMGEKAVAQRQKLEKSAVKEDDDDDDEEAKPKKKGSKVAKKTSDDDEETANKKIDEKAEQNIIKIEKEETEDK